ncbi:MAG TPA: DUF4405 domain-containing protein [Patescibacteria group bacterium]|nr:DUF4405 domain-containing protein [Patescibacteria group bacterium]
MKKIKINALVDIFAFVAGLIVAKSGLVLWFILPSGSGGGFQGGKGGGVEKSFFFLSRHEWQTIHNWVGLILIILILLHLILHWSYIKNINKILLKNKED